jgi:hypothetical protein
VVKAETGLVLVDPLGKPVRPELYSDSLRRLTLAARLGVIHLYLVRRTLAVAMDRAGVAPVDAAPPLATQGRILTMYESTQGVHSFRAGLAPLFDLEPDHVRVISPYGAADSAQSSRFTPPPSSRRWRHTNCQAVL